MVVSGYGSTSGYQWTIYIYIYHLVMTNSLPWYRWPIEIDGLPTISSMVMFHGELLNNQRVTVCYGKWPICTVDDHQKKWPIENVLLKMAMII